MKRESILFPMEDVIPNNMKNQALQKILSN